MEPFDGFTSIPDLVDHFRNGKGYNNEGRYSNYKLCLTSTDIEYLAAKLRELSELSDCFRVKYRPKSKSGMFLGRATMTSDQVTGELWVELRKDKGLMCSIQDDEFCRQFRDQHKVAKIKQKLGDALGNAE